MRPVDIILALLITGGAVYLLYRSLFKKKGYCPGCSQESCQSKNAKGKRT